MKYVYRRDVSGQWRWTFYGRNGEAIAVASESYHNETDCLHGIALMKGSNPAPVHRG